MDAKIISTRFEDVEDKVVVVPIYEEALQEIIKSPRNKFEAILKEVVGDTGFKAEHKQLHLMNTLGIIKSKLVLLAGLGKKSEVDSERIRKLYGVIVKRIKSLKITSFTLLLPQPLNIMNVEDILAYVVEGVELGDYINDKYKSEKKDYKGVERYNIISDNHNAEKIIKKAKIICKNTLFVREIVNESGSSLTPLKIAQHSLEISKRFKLKCNVLDEKELESLGLNLILSVGKAGNYPPRLIIIEYNGDTSSKDNVMIVGKGITFDSGGLDIKTASGMETMKMDMAGAGAVLGVISTIAELKLKRNVIGVIPTCENLIGPKSYKPGDIITAYNKTTVEVLNTDAEGRLVLGDAIAYGIDKYKPKLLIDLATLTGACLVVFGEYVSALVSNDDDLAERLFSAGQRTFERVWKLPLYDEYKEMIKSDIADIKNIGHKSGYAGTLTGAAFINRFVNKTKWAHLDIAGTAWSEGEQDYISKGGTGYGVRLLTEFLELI